jgi:hypothetical protein
MRYVPSSSSWSIVPAVVVSCATILDVAIALCNGKSDCAHAISPPNLKNREAGRLPSETDLVDG